MHCCASPVVHRAVPAGWQSSSSSGSPSAGFLSEAPEADGAVGGVELKWGLGLWQGSFSKVPSLLKAGHEVILVLGERELYRDDTSSFKSQISSSPGIRHLEP